ncbi:MAG: T9SS type A sorting domain-containing protein, partial [bacterium]|nr:T9SS type A sorting domain-containing protein [bacterium]
RVDTEDGSVESWSETITGEHTHYATAYSVDCGIESAPSTSLTLTGHDLAFPPASITVTTPETCDSIRLSWPAGTGEIESYVISRDGDSIAAVTGLAYTDHEVDDANDHEYAVASYNQYCGTGDFTDPVTGNILPLLQIEADVPDTVVDNTWYVIDSMVFCSNVDSVRFFISLDGGANYTYLRTISPHPLDSVFVPHDEEAHLNCILLATSHRDDRVDSTESDLFVIVPNAVGPEHNLEIPKDFMLEQNYPNPFNPSTTVRFGVPKMADVRIEVFDVLGRLVATPAEGTFQAGWHTIVWDCSSCPTGMYLLRMNTDEKVLLRKMMLMK